MFFEDKILLQSSLQEFDFESNSEVGVVEMQKSNGTRDCTELPFNQSRISIISIINICGNIQFIKNQQNQHNQHMWEHPIHQESAK